MLSILASRVPKRSQAMIGCSMNTQQKDCLSLFALSRSSLSPGEVAVFPINQAKTFSEDPSFRYHSGPRTLRGIVWEKETASTSHLLSKAVSIQTKSEKILSHKHSSEERHCFLARTSRARQFPRSRHRTPQISSKDIFQRNKHFPKTPKEKQQRRKKTVAQTASFSHENRNKQQETSAPVRTRFSLDRRHPARHHVYFECIKNSHKGSRRAFLSPINFDQEESRYARIFGNKSVAVFPHWNETNRAR